MRQINAAHFPQGSGRVPVPPAVEVPVKDWDASFDADGEGVPVKARNKLNKQQLEYCEHIRRTQT